MRKGESRGIATAAFPHACSIPLPKQKMSEYLTRKEVTEYLKIGQSLADKIINDPHFDGKVNLGRRVLVSKEKLDEYMEARMG